MNNLKFSKSGGITNSKKKKKRKYYWYNNNGAANQLFLNRSVLQRVIHRIFEASNSLSPIYRILLLPILICHSQLNTRTITKDE